MAKEHSYWEILTGFFINYNAWFWHTQYASPQETGKPAVLQLKTVFKKHTELASAINLPSMSQILRLQYFILVCFIEKHLGRGEEGE